MMSMQSSLMKYDPASGEARPYPSHAKQWRDWNGRGTAWLFNPWTGERRSAGDVGSDVVGHLIQPPGEQLVEAQLQNNACNAPTGAILPQASLKRVANLVASRIMQPFNCCNLLI
jgi:hypothetical protein